MPRPTPPRASGLRATSPSWPAERDLANIQGIVLHAYGMRFAAHVLLAVTDAVAARAFIGALVTPASGVPQIQFATVWQKKPDTCVNVGFTYAGLRALGASAGAFNGADGTPISDYAPFVNGSGSSASAQLVGDLGLSDPSNWIFTDTPNGSASGIAQENVVHVDLVVYGVCREDVLDQVGVLKRAYAAGFREVAVLESQDVLGHGKIYWDIQDGISDPTLYPDNPTNQIPDGSPDFMTDPGWFVLGQSKMPPANVFSAATLKLPNPNLAFTYGTFAALRRLQQHIDEPDTGFDAFIDGNWKLMQSTYQLGNEAVARAALKAVIIGRWPSGTSLIDSPIVTGMTEAPGELPPDHVNNFVYASDALGLSCPHTSHIRRGNPRDDNVSSVPTSRIMRRAFPYQEPYVTGDQSINERGLFGFFISASLAQGFELVMNSWINGPGTPALDPADPAIGYPISTAPPPQYTLSLFDTPTPPPPIPTPMVQFTVTPFVTTRGSAYVFIPGLPGLTWIANGCPASG